MKSCINCGAPLDDDALFCQNCGKKIVPQGVLCPRCGTELKLDSVFCARCGIRLDEWNKSPTMPIQDEEQVYDWEEERGKTWWYVGGAVLAVALMGLGIWGWQSDLLGGSQEQDMEIQNSNHTSYERAEMLGTNGLCLLKGTIGKYGVEMMITVDDEAIGLLHYNSQRKGINLMLKGNVEGDGKMTIYEFAPSGENTGCFDGVFDGESFKGTFRNFTHGKTYSFALVSVLSLSNFSERDVMDFHE